MLFREKTIKKMLADIIGNKLCPEINQLVDEIKELVGPADAVPKIKKDMQELRLKKDKEIKEMKLNRDLEERDLKHLIKIKEEKLEVEFEKKILKSQHEYKDKEMKLQSEYFVKAMEQLDTARKEMKEVYTEIMKRLPNVNFDITKDIVK